MTSSRRVRFGAALAVTSVGLGAVACGSTDAGLDDATNDDVEVIAAVADRAPSDPRAAGDAGRLVTEFGFDLYGQVRNESGDVVVSPYSVAAALAMTRAGAAGLTAEEMDLVLHADGVDDLHAAFGSLDATLATRSREIEVPEGEPLVVELSFGNALWPQRGFPFEQDFLARLAEHYGVGVNGVDYANDTEAARQAINGWVATETRDRITELLSPGVLGPNTRLVLTNALYLNAPWQFPFDEGATRDAEFTLLDDGTVTVPFMALTDTLRYGDGDGWSAVELPYAGGSLAMTVFVPDPGAFAVQETGLDAAMAETVAAALIASDVELRLPSWEHRTQVTLNEALQSLGMPSAFGPEADFSAMSSEPLVISDVVHEVFVSVDEAGTEAAAATAVVMVETAAPAAPSVSLNVDRPFLYWIVDTETDAILFLGRVTDPSVS